MIKLSPSILSSDFTRLGEEIKKIDSAGCDWIHLDIMDGVFVPNISFGIPVVADIRKCTDKFLDVHLMITDPARYVEQFATAGADMITVHVEACENVMDTIDRIHKLGKKAGLALNPETAVEDITDYIDMVDMILIMTVHPGFGGQSYIDECNEKIEVVNAIVHEYNLPVLIQVDGGVTIDNVKIPLECGANVIVAGTAVFKGDAESNIEKFRKEFAPYESDVITH